MHNNPRAGLACKWIRQGGGRGKKMLIKWRGGGFIHPSEEGGRANPIGPRSLPTSINASSSSSSVPSSRRRCGCSRKRGGSPRTTLRGKSSEFLFAQNSSEQLAALPFSPQTLLEGGERIQRGRENSVIDHLFVLLRRRWRRTGGGGYPPSLLTCHGSSLSLSSSPSFPPLPPTGDREEEERRNAH